MDHVSKTGTLAQLLPGDIVAVPKENHCDVVQVPGGEGGSDRSLRLVLQYFFPTCWYGGDDLGNLLT